MNEHGPHLCLIIEGVWLADLSHEREVFTNPWVTVLVKVFTNTTARGRNSEFCHSKAVALSPFQRQKEAGLSPPCHRQLAPLLPAPESKLYSLKLHGIFVSNEMNKAS